MLILKEITFHSVGNRVVTLRCVGFNFGCHTLDPVAAAKITASKARLKLGNISNIKWFAGIGEYKIDWGPGYRIYLAQEGKQLIILFGGGVKKNSKAI